MKFAAHVLSWRSGDVFDVEVTDDYNSIHTMSYRCKADQGSQWITLIWPDQTNRKLMVPMSCYKLLKKSSERGLTRLWADCIESDLLGDNLKAKMEMLTATGHMYANATTVPYVAMWDDAEYFDRLWTAQVDCF